MGSFIRQIAIIRLLVNAYLARHAESSLCFHSPLTNHPGILGVPFLHPPRRAPRCLANQTQFPHILSPPGPSKPPTPHPQTSQPRPTLIDRSLRHPPLSPHSFNNLIHLSLVSSSSPSQQQKSTYLRLNNHTPHNHLT
jgi:hypothetical protein